MIRLALVECRKLGIDRVLMSCYKDNIASRKSIIKNGGVLENEILLEDGKIAQRFWISLKKRYANVYYERGISKFEQKVLKVEDEKFIGDVYYNHFLEIKNKHVLENGKCILDSNYEWVEFFDYNAKIKLTVMYDDKGKIIEWYFDIAREIGKEDGIAYEDDLYLDVVVTPQGKITLLDEDELKDALNRLEITKEDYEMAYNEANTLMKNLKGNVDKLKDFTDKYLEIMRKTN